MLPLSFNVLHTQWLGIVLSWPASLEIQDEPYPL